MCISKLRGNIMQAKNLGFKNKRMPIKLMQQLKNSPKSGNMII